MSADKTKNSLNTLSEEELSRVGYIKDGKGRSGSFIQVDENVEQQEVSEKSVEVMSMKEALEKYDWLEDYRWKNVDPHKNATTEAVNKQMHNGYFIRSLEGGKSPFPVQSCMVLKKERFAQHLHSIIIAEEDSELNIITGCTTTRTIQGKHYGITEIYVKPGARVTFTMIHNWGEEVEVRPVTGVYVDKGGEYVSNYICLAPSRDIVMYPTTVLAGEGASTSMSSLLLSGKGSFLDVGARAILAAPQTRAQLISRVVAEGGTAIARGHLKGTAPGCKGHLECNGLILTDDSRIHAVPELESEVQDVDLSHEAAVGKIAKDEINYLMARGVDEETAQGIIIRGFLDISILGLPPELEMVINEWMDKVAAGSL